MASREEEGEEEGEGEGEGKGERVVCPITVGLRFNCD
jgi:hypothetical protein